MLRSKPNYFKVVFVEVVVLVVHIIVINVVAVILICVAVRIEFNPTSHQASDSVT